MANLGEEIVRWECHRRGGGGRRQNAGGDDGFFRVQGG